MKKVILEVPIAELNGAGEPPLIRRINTMLSPLAARGLNMLRMGLDQSGATRPDGRRPNPESSPAAIECLLEMIATMRSDTVAEKAEPVAAKKPQRKRGK